MSMVNSLKKFMGMDDDDDMYDDDYGYEEEEENVISLDSNRIRRPNKPVSSYASHNKTIKIVKPKSFDETKVIAEDLRAGVITLVNTTALEKKDAQRLLDFICGAAYVLDGLVQEVESGVFVISPTDITVNSFLKDNAKEKSEGPSFINWNIK